MELAHGLHLAYCTNIHRGEDWAETFAGLRDYTLRVKAEVSPDEPYAIGLRLSQKAALELSEAGSEGALAVLREESIRGGSLRTQGHLCRDRCPSISDRDSRSYLGVKVS